MCIVREMPQVVEGMVSNEGGKVIRVNKKGMSYIEPKKKNGKY